jgi:hypothetical protein
MERIMAHQTWLVAVVSGLVSGLVPGAEAEPPTAAPAFLLVDGASAPVRFAASEIRAALAMRGQTLVELDAGTAAPGLASSPLQIVVAGDEAASGRAARAWGVRPLGSTAPESYGLRLRTAGTGQSVVVLGSNATGAMYGGLDVAEAIRLGTVGELREADQTPFQERRGIKFNIPLDVRTPSYSDNSSAAQANIPEMWSFDFWRTMLDEMARHRYNTLTLWNLHPFPSIVKVPEYPDVALDDVLRGAPQHFDETFPHSGAGMFKPAMLQGAEVVRRMTIADKIRFWRGVMQHAADRGIEVYWFTWNTWAYGAEGKHGLVRSQTSEELIRYFRASVRETVLTYPLLAGIGITAGEGMEERSDGFSKEKWLWRTYGEGVRDALAQQPGRKLRLIHRYHQTAQREIVQEFKDLPATLDLSFKYAIAHMYSIPDPPFIKQALPHLGGGLRTWLTVRNDDVYSFRWGDPEFARSFVKNMPGRDKCAGFYMGPDGFIWGRDFLDARPGTSPPTIVEKQWYSFMLWGRLAYDPELPDALFLKTLASRFPEVPPARLDEAWRSASRTFPLITRFLWGDIDLRWFPEASLSHPRHRGYYDVGEFASWNTMPGSGVLNVREWRRAVLAGQAPRGTTPLEVAAELQGNGATALAAAKELRAVSGVGPELDATLADIEMMATLGLYYAAKVRGACSLALLDATRDEAHRRESVGHLEEALRHWSAYARLYAGRYRERVLYNRVGWVDRTALTAEVQRDVELARSWTPGSIRDDTEAGTADRPFRE